VDDEAQPVGRPVPRRLFEHIATGVVRRGTIFVAHRARDPGHVVVRDETSQGGDEASAPAAGNALSVLAPIRDGAAIRDDDQLAPVCHPAQA
jgi:hypothetical protein